MKTQKDKDETQLQRIREDINTTDAAIVGLLNRRAALSIEAGKLKVQNNAPVFRPGREEKVLEGLRAANAGPLPDKHLLAVYREILSSSRALQRSLRIAFLGPEGTFSHVACVEYFGADFSGTPMPDLEQVFLAVTKHDCDLAIVPVENSVNGTVLQSLDLFAAHDVHVQAECYSRIRLCLVSRENSPAGIKSVYSHSQALGQCSNWLRDKMPNAERISMESSALAATRAVSETGSAAICHPATAENLGLNILASGIEDRPDNRTRFFIIGPEAAGEKDGGGAPLKSSLLFIIADRPGSLATVLQSIFQAGVNISKLESRPMRGEPWKYIFFADLDCDITAPENAALLAEMRANCLRVRILGAYFSGRQNHGAA